MTDKEHIDEQHDYPLTEREFRNKLAFLEGMVAGLRERVEELEETGREYIGVAEWTSSVDNPYGHVGKIFKDLLGFPRKK